jgi:DNA polymerase III subunit delta
VSSLLLIAGDDDLLLARETERRVDALVAADPSLEVSRHDAAELDHLPELRTTSLFGGRTCVVVRGVERLSGDSGGGLKAELEAYAAAPSPEAVLVLVARGTATIQRLARLVAEHGERIDVKRPADWDEQAWDRLVGDEFRRLGRKGDATAIAAVRLHAGADPTTIASQVATVCATAPEVAVLTATEVEAVLAGFGQRSGFEVADAVAARDPGAAIVALAGALESGEAPLRIVGALTFRVRQLLQARAGADARTVGVPPTRLRAVKAQAERFGPGELAWCHDRLAELDLALKGSDLPDALVLEVAVIELATPRTVGAPFNPLAR